MTFSDPMTLLVASYVVPSAVLAFTAWSIYLGGTLGRTPARCGVRRRDGRKRRR